MDGESITQIEKIVTTAVSGVEGRLRAEMQAQGASLRKELGEQMQAQGASLRKEFREGIEEAKRHTGVLYEDVLHKIDLVVEGHQALNEKIENLEAKMEHEFLETRSLM